MSVAVHNPSTNDMKRAKIAVPKGNYEAKVFNKDSQKLEVAPVSVLCHDDVDTKLEKVESCFAHVSYTTKSRDVSLVELTRKDMLEDIQVKKDKIYVGDKIRRDNVFLTFSGFNNETGLMNFELENVESNLTNKLEVNIKYWKSNELMNTWH
jgi:hypothetical protein